MFGPSFRVTRSRGVLMPWPDSAAVPSDFGHDEEDDGARAAAFAMATVHPSSVLRADDQDAAFAALVADLAVAAGALVG
jgi:uracil-DNA glycosylase